MIGSQDPAAALQGGLLIVLAGLCRPGALLRGGAWRSRLVPLALAASICVAAVGVRSHGSAGEFGELVTRKEIGDRLEFKRVGPARLLPTPSIWESLSGQVGVDQPEFVFQGFLEQCIIDRFVVHYLRFSSNTLTRFNQPYHYLGSAIWYTRIGHAAGEAMLELMEDGRLT